VAQSTVRLIVDAQNAINPLKRVNEQTKNLSQNTNKLKNRLDQGKKSFDKFGNSGKKASSNVNTLVGTLKKLAAAFAVIQTAKFVFVKTAELETQRKSLEVLTGSLTKTNQIIKELQDFGSVTPFTSSELIEQSKRLKAFGFETDVLADSVKRLSDIAGATGADLSGIATAFGQIRAKGKLQQEENLQLLERGVDITTELKRITGLQGEEFESAMRKGKIGADLVNQAFLNLTDEGGAFFGGATAQADTLNGRLSTLVDTVETLARTVGDELGDEIKTVLNLAISAVGQITKLVERVGQANKVGRLNLAKIAMEARGEAREKLIEETGNRFAGVNPFNKEEKAREKQLFEEIKARKIKEVLEIKELDLLEQKNQKIEKITQNLDDSSDSANKLDKTLKKTEKPITTLEEKTNATTTALEGNILITDLLNQNLGDTSLIVDNLSLGSNKFADSLFNVKSEADLLKEKFMEIGQGIESGIVSGLTDAVMGTKTLAQAATGVLQNLKRQLIELAMQRAVSGIGNFFGKALGGIFGGAFGGGGAAPLITDKVFDTGFDTSLISAGAFANGGRPPVGRASLVGERGPELFVPSSAGTIIPNKALAGANSVTNVITVNVDANSSDVSGNNAEANQLGQQLAGAIQAELIKQKRAGGLLA